MAQTGVSSTEPPPSPANAPTSFLRKLFGRSHHQGAPDQPDAPQEQDLDPDDLQRPGLFRRSSRKAIAGLPRAQTFKRQQSERRNNLAPVEPSSAERRAASVDRRVQSSRTDSQTQSFPRTSAPDFFEHSYDRAPSVPSIPASPVAEQAPGESLERIVSYDRDHGEESHIPDAASTTDAHSITTSQYEAAVHDELERIWILNLSMHFRDKSKREKFFVTYRERDILWRRVTISLDYRNAPENSLEMDLLQTKFQREKSGKIYEAIRESLENIQFYDTVTNLKLQTTDGRLHVHVVEDVNEIIHYPPVRQVQHLGCRRIRERDIDFDSHMSGFVYKVGVGGEVLIKKEIPGPDTIDEFLYEIIALNRLRYSHNVIRFYGVVVDDHDEYVKGLLISYADQGALIDVLYDNRQDSELGLPWPKRQKWARQIVQGLSDIHESGFVQGDFTLSNIVIDDVGDAKIIDINRRGCPVGWEPPEATPLIESNQRISMYIGVKSDLYQLGMVLWALATQEDEPEAHGRPLVLQDDVLVPLWYRQMVEICLSDDPRRRMQASSLLAMFPPAAESDEIGGEAPPSISVEDGYSLQEYFVDEYGSNAHARVRTVQPPNDWSYVSLGTPYVDPAMAYSQDPYYYTRGRSPPSPLPSNYGRCDSPHLGHNISGWAGGRNIAPSYSDVGGDDEIEQSKSATPTTNRESTAALEALDDRVRQVQEKLEETVLEPVPHDLRQLDQVEPPNEARLEPEATLASSEVAEVLAKGPQDEESPHGTVEIRADATSPDTIKNVPAEEAGDEKGIEHAESHEAGITAPEKQIDSTTEEDAAQSPAASVVPEAIPDPLVGDPSSEVADGDSDPAGARDTTPRPASPAKTIVSPVDHLPESLKGVGAAHLETNEHAMREKVSLEEDFGCITTATPITTEAQK